MYFSGVAHNPICKHLPASLVVDENACVFIRAAEAVHRADFDGHAGDAAGSERPILEAAALASFVPSA